MTTQVSRILVTGVTGFLGTHIVDQLLKAKLSIRGVVRSAKLTSVQEIYSEEVSAGKIDFVMVDDLINGSFADALKDVAAVIHAASPLPGRMQATEAINASVQGSLNILRQAESAGTKRFVLVSSIATTFDLQTGHGFTENDWNPVTEEQILHGPDNAAFAYAGHKTLAERAVWDFADKHPNIDVTSLNPSLFYGPFAPGYRNPDGNLEALSTNDIMYKLIEPTGTLPSLRSFTPVVDVARALVGSLTAPLASEIGRKRILLAGEAFNFREATTYIGEARPALRDRLSEAAKNSGPFPLGNVDNSRAQKLFGVTITPWKQTILEAIDDLIKLENEWKNNGVTPYGYNNFWQ